MSLIISPDYELFIAIFFVMYVLHGFVNIVVGLAKVEHTHRDRYGGREIFAGIVAMLIAGWVLL